MNISPPYVGDEHLAARWLLNCAKASSWNYTNVCQTLSGGKGVDDLTDIPRRLRVLDRHVGKGHENTSEGTNIMNSASAGLRSMLSGKHLLNLWRGQLGGELRELQSGTGSRLIMNRLIILHMLKALGIDDSSRDTAVEIDDAFGAKMPVCDEGGVMRTIANATGAIKRDIPTHKVPKAGMRIRYQSS